MTHELYIPPKWDGRNKANGRFLKGHTPHNKGKKWGEWMTKKGQKRSAKGWRNFEEHRPKTRPDTAGRCRKVVVAVMDDGRWCVFSYTVEAAEWVGGIQENVCRCCRFNQRRHVNLKTGMVNTDHKYKGVRFYFESDGIWTTNVMR